MSISLNRIERRGRRRARAVIGHHDAHFLGLVGADGNQLAAVGARRQADEIHQRRGQAVHADDEVAVFELLVDDADGVAVAQRAVRQPHIHRIAVVDDVDAFAVAGGERVDHHAAGERDHRGVEHGARAQQLEEGLLALHAALDVDIGVVGDQPGGAAELRHHIVAGVDAQPALDAAEAGAVANIDAGRADMHALQAIDAVAGRLARARNCSAFFAEQRGSPRS